MFAKQIKHLTGLSAVFLLSFGLASNHAQAVFIDFDDIVAIPAEPFTGCFCGHILGNEYESQGLIFNGDSSWLTGATLPDGTNQNAVWGKNEIYLGFTGVLPNFVSFNIHAPLQSEASYMDVFGVDGYLFTHVSGGWQGTEESSTPYIPGELVSITASEGIVGMHIYSFYGLRTGPHIDNLTFESRTVPEPSSFLLLIPCIAGLFWQRMKKNTRSITETHGN